MYKFLGGYTISFLLPIYLATIIKLYTQALLDHTVILCLTAEQLPDYFPKGLYHFTFPLAVYEFQFLHILIDTYCLFDYSHPS